MSDASKTGLTEYVRKGSMQAAYAGKITAIQPYIRGAITLYFGDLDKQATVRPEWVGRNNPQVGGYFVVEEAGPVPNCYYASAEAFEGDFEGAQS